ncbi:type IV pilus secretin PilQ [uncultured Aquabacterium sp.]|uniref:type IV pilus secretin PilQ n=1 Tax=uncultured Aquabacterium sp. TaxID=158753 RepID=UPI00263658F9|nr:type IV pilus secretin PilQ [uncultured Aquabacterium sp.]
MKPWRMALAGLSLACVSPLSWAAAAIQAISSAQQAGAEVVRIELSEPLTALPAGFVVQTPPRIAIDLPGVTSSLARNQVEINQGNLRSVNVAQAGERTRLVLNLRQAATYKAQLQGNALLLVLDPAAAGTPESAPVARAAKADDAVHFADSRNATPLALKDIDFRRGQDGAGRVVVELPNNQVGVDIKQQGQSLMVEFLKTDLPERLRRRFDVTDFGTPVRQMSASQSGDRVRLLVEPKGDWEHSAYQTDNQFVLEVRQRKADPNKLTPGPGYAGERLSLNFQNIEVRSLLQVIADFTNFNVVTSDSVTGNVTLRLKDVPWDQALDIILQAKGLGVRKSGNVLWIAPKDEINAKEKLDLEAKAQVAQLEPTRTQSFQLNYTKAEVIARGLLGTSTGGSSGSTASRILSPRGSVIFETRTNQLFVSDIPSKLEEVQQMIAKIDIPVRQVLIEARIIEAVDSFGRTLGARLGTSNQTAVASAGKLNLGLSGNYSGVVAETGQSLSGSAASVANSYFVNLPAQALSTGASAATLGVSLFSSSVNHALNLEISALEADGKGKVVSSPRVITADQVKAIIESGEELPYQQATSSGATSVTFRKANLKLEVTPQITPEGSIIMSVDINKDSVGRVTTAGFAINTKHVETQVLVENGGTVVIGGIFTQSEDETENKVPLLGDIPVVGFFFKNNVRNRARSELLVFLTPKVVSDKTALR